MWKILQQQKSDDYVLGTGKSLSVREFLTEAFDYVGLEPDDHIRIDEKYFRPTEVENLIADSAKAKKAFNWKPKITISDLAKIMIDSDMNASGLTPIGEGYAILEKKFPRRWWLKE